MGCARTLESKPTERNQRTYRQHRREVWWQVFLPLVIGILVIGSVSGGLVAAEYRDASVWADVSLIWLILPVCFLALIPFAIFAALLVGATLGLQRLPPLALMLQQSMKQVEDAVKRGADRAAEPVLRIGGFTARLRALRRK